MCPRRIVQEDECGADRAGSAKRFELVGSYAAAFFAGFDANFGVAFLLVFPFSFAANSCHTAPDEGGRAPVVQLRCQPFGEKQQVALHQSNWHGVADGFQGSQPVAPFDGPRRVEPCKDGCALSSCYCDNFEEAALTSP